jgi:hypothetical protein
LAFTEVTLKVDALHLKNIMVVAHFHRRFRSCGGCYIICILVKWLMIRF